MAPQATRKTALISLLVTTAAALTNFEVENFNVPNCDGISFFNASISGAGTCDLISGGDSTSILIINEGLQAGSANLFSDAGCDDLVTFTRELQPGEEECIPDGTNIRFGQSAP